MNTDAQYRGQRLSPRTMRAHLWPADGPERVTATATHAGEQIDAYERALAAERDAKQALAKAPRHDAQADAQAHAAGKPIPAATIPDKRDAFDRAKRATNLSESAAVAAVEAHEAAIAEHQGELIEAGHAALDDALAGYRAQVEAVEAASNEAAHAAGRLRALYGYTAPASEQRRRTFDKPAMVELVSGNASSMNTSVRTVPARPRDLAEALAKLAERFDVPRPQAPTPEDEAFQANRREMHRMARGGVYAG